MLANGIDFIPLPEPRVAIDHHVRMQPAARPQFDVLADDAIRPDFAVGADLRLGMDNRRWMNHITFLYRATRH